VILQYGLGVLFFVWVKMMVFILLLAVLDGGFGIPVKGRNIVAVFEVAVVIALITTLSVWP